MKDANQEHQARTNLEHLQSFLSGVGPKLASLSDEVISEVCENLEELAIRRNSAPIYRSFTRTMMDYMTGKITDVMLYRCGGLWFNCHRDHVFPSEATIDDLGETYPMEITWVRVPGVPLCEHPKYGPLSCFVDTSRVPASIVPDSLKEQFSQFVAIVEQLDAIGLVSFSSDRDPRSFDEDLRIEKASREDFHQHWSHDMGPLS